jgi:hypothetical protein
LKIFPKRAGSVKKYGAFLQNSIIFEDFFLKIQAFSTITRIFKYIFSGIEAFLG